LLQAPQLLRVDVEHGSGHAPEGKADRGQISFAERTVIQNLPETTDIEKTAVGVERVISCSKRYNSFEWKFDYCPKPRLATYHFEKKGN